MQTFYIDVYFLINFCVDALALYFSVRITAQQSNIARLILSASILSVAACLYILYLEESALRYVLLPGAYILAILVISKRAGFYRKLKLGFCFSLLSFVIGGVVFAGYEFLGNVFENLKIEVNNGAENVKFLYLAVLILIALCVVKLFLLFVTNAGHEKCARICFSLAGGDYELDAMVDSGNLLRDPLTNTPVILVKAGALHLPFEADDSVFEREIDIEAKKQIRLIPARSLGSEKMLLGFYLNHCEVHIGKHKSEMSVCIAIDKEGGSYGGYSALVPSALLDYVI